MNAELTRLQSLRDEFGVRFIGTVDQIGEYRFAGYNTLLIGIQYQLVQEFVWYLVSLGYLKYDHYAVENEVTWHYWRVLTDKFAKVTTLEEWWEALLNDDKR